MRDAASVRTCRLRPHSVTRLRFQKGRHDDDVLDERSHMPHVEETETFLRMVRSFLDGEDDDRADAPQ